MDTEAVDSPGLKLIEQCSGVGELVWQGRIVRPVRYRVSRFQGMAASGLPVPGLHRIEGALELGAVADPAGMIGASLTLRLADGRALGVTLVAEDGRVLAEGHGPSKCRCC